MDGHDYKADRERLENILDQRLSAAGIVVPVPNQAAKVGKRVSGLIREIIENGE